MSGAGMRDAGGLIAWPFEPLPDTALDGSIIHWFEGVAQRHAGRLAVSDVRRALTYAELAALVERIAAAIAGAAVAPGPVAIMLRNEVRLPAAVLGILAAGRPFIPLDVDHPPERNSMIAVHAGTVAALSTADLAGRARAVFPPGVPVLDIEALGNGAPARAARPKPNDLAAIMYTSGSTGRPKGVCHDHRGLLFGVQQWTNLGHLSCEDRMCLVTSPSNLAGIRHILCTLLTGASLHLLPPRDLQPAGLVREIRARGITVFRSVPTLFRHVVEALGERERLESVRLVALSGDRVEWSDVEAFQRGCREDAVLAVCLASTEAGANYTWWFVDEALRREAPRLPIGRSVGDPSVALVDDDGRPIGDGEVGEIVLTSRYLAHGYWREPELTARAFGTDPQDPIRRTFRTGDLARCRPDGLFEFIGRKDHQIKLHGQRIEVAEIESGLTACTGVRDAAIAVRRDASGEPQSLVGYAELRQGVDGLLPRHLMAMLSQRVPSHMMPSAISIVTELPRLPNHKIDRGRLAEMDARAAASPVPVDDPVVGEIIAVFEMALDVAATPDDNVLSLGGDSMQAVTIALELAERFNIEIPIDTFEATQTIRELAAWIASRRSGETAAVAAP